MMLYANSARIVSRERLAELESMQQHPHTHEAAIFMDIFTLLMLKLGNLHLIINALESTMNDKKEHHQHQHQQQPEEEEEEQERQTMKAARVLKFLLSFKLNIA